MNRIKMDPVQDYLCHHGILGQRWGKKNGPPYPLNRSRKVFISGSSKTQNKDSGYYRKDLPEPIQQKIDGYMKEKAMILVGEAPGIDSQVQDYLNNKNYKKVTVYTSYDSPRYLANKDWKVKKVDAKGLEPDSKEFLRKKDEAMTKDASSGLAIVLENGGASATRNNVQRLMDSGKDVEMFELTSNPTNDNWSIQNEKKR